MSLEKPGPVWLAYMYFLNGEPKNWKDYSFIIHLIMPGSFGPYDDRREWTAPEKITYELYRAIGIKWKPGFFKRLWNRYITNG